MDGGLEETAAAHLLDGDEAAAEILDAPALGVIVLLRPRHHPGVPLCDLMRIQETTAADLLNRAHAAAEVRHSPMLGGVESPELAG